MPEFSNQLLKKTAFILDTQILSTLIPKLSTLLLMYNYFCINIVKEVYWVKTRSYRTTPKFTSLNRFATRH